MQRNDTKYGLNRRLDNKWKIYFKNVACKHQSQEGFIENFCVNKFGLLIAITQIQAMVMAIKTPNLFTQKSLLAKTISMANYFTSIYLLILRSI